ncbi:MAG TPA: hypothetical protein DDW52_05270 [Planctomycetaceae bacterium]|nr:hypothetical protein [Planctomycetaceae bacterium]
MSLRLVILPRAELDVAAIFNYIHERNAKGALDWLTAFEVASTKTVNFPESYSLAPEDLSLNRQVRQFFFRTRKGHMYRGLFVVVGDELRVLRVRGKGQPPLAEDELDDSE